MPRSAATCAIGRPLSSASRTPRSKSSSGYFLGLDMTAEDLLSPGQHPGCEVPAKPGPAQSRCPEPVRPCVPVGAAASLEGDGHVTSTAATNNGAPENPVVGPLLKYRR